MKHTSIKDFAWYVKLDQYSEKAKVLIYEYLKNIYKNSNFVFNYTEDTTGYTNIYDHSDSHVDRVLISEEYTYSPHRLAKEIKFSFEEKIILKSVELPDIETDRERKVRELKETITKAQKQLDELGN